MKLTKEKEAQLAKLMKEYNASDLGELVDILPDLDLELLEDEDELPQQEEIDLDAIQELETAVIWDKDVIYPFVPYPFNN